MRVRVLQVLNMGVNDLYELPSDFGKLQGLTKLDLHDNLLEAVPDSMCKMPNLQVNMIFLNVFCISL
jgi:Leucine-rich repeat (LRR) protein